MGKVLELIAGKDGEARGVKLKLITKYLCQQNSAEALSFNVEVCSVMREFGENHTNEGNINLVGNAGKHANTFAERRRNSLSTCSHDLFYKVVFSTFGKDDNYKGEGRNSS
ncbi:hypothetical protein OS493_032270 [Desmophyllum pertusum]|uniref:Uncharacterized protein n=1 Tax=Desmophyllum pertusum TaxID=174260 RepID=A0A9W9Z9Z5_9CNID|nr:hypothetical protein OS493_032270 [Desmophyllum pertusum]